MRGMCGRKDGKARLLCGGLIKPNGLWYEIETDSTTARTINDTNRGFVLYHLLPTGGYYEP